ncbi:G-type lectin S-receptor-like serine/threonine-protein kinase SD1-13 [Corylus avellana]|uniref:G-type lectin S-receptor-like serine/threonine-protein kinase SD1-13 n=1 Tax=Corylus avellana TaxID=13451 RepID=UPI00286BA397|nr:G-type lectin S-receptor-like serine/threonine-protein kinase SD1-13 [Corylus avellana]
MYKLGFFPIEKRAKYYVAIFITNTSENVVWVANRENPFPNPSALLTMDPDGNLVISDGGLLHLVTNTTSRGNDAYAKLLDTGNLILTNRALDVLWQSFDYPTDTLLPGMKLNGANDHPVLTSWKSQEDPASGPFSLQYLASRKELILREGSEPYWTSSLRGVLAGIFVIDGDYITWPSKKTFETRRLVLDLNGQLLVETWMEGDQGWSSQRITTCGAYPVCGVSSICNETADADSRCYCLPGFKRESAFAGCKRKTDLQCTHDINVQKDWFLRIPEVYLPRYPLRLHVGKASECESACLNNCSCTGYAYDQEHRCLVWDGPLLNLKHFSADSLYETDFYLKLAPPEFTKGNKQLWKILVPATSIAVAVTLGLFVYYVRRKLTRKGEDLLLLDLGMTQKANNSKDGDSREVQMPLFSFASVSAATHNFSVANKLGEGGFGPVYKGILQKGDEVAVKRLSKRSGQGWEELKNEAMLIAKLQHKNLVRLLGCCIEQDEKILVYEYMPNKSLDFFIFANQEKRRILDWRTRVGVIEGIAQGLLYLHQYSRLRIIHRDLKPSNILLDIDMNSKISDFGMARIFGGNESQANTNRIVGTYGYMSPEYALKGLFSIKSDVFSFGVLLLEIAWELWSSDRGSDLVDPLLDDISSMHMVLRYVNIALLCVQESAEDRPTMSDVVAMLSNEGVILPYPKEPAFLNMRSMSQPTIQDKIKSFNGYWKEIYLCKLREYLKRIKPEVVQPTATNEMYIIAKACMGLIPKAGELLSEIAHSLYYSSRISPLIASLLLLFCLAFHFTNATITGNTIQAGQSLNTSETIESANGKYKLGFFGQVNSAMFHVGIRFTYVSDRNVLWVANREQPFPNSSAVLTLNPDGNLVISDGSLLYVVANTSGGNDTSATLSDTGNLVLKRRAEVLWQSFDHPTDTLLPGMKVEEDKTGWSLTSWKNNENPAPGLFSLHLGSRKELIIMEGSKPCWSSPLIGELADKFVIDGENISYTISNNYPSEFRRVSLSIKGKLRLQTWEDNSSHFENLSDTLKCGAYAFCGEFTICNETADRPCDCLPGFKAYAANSTQGCKRKTILPCRDDVEKHGFRQMSMVYLPSNPQQLQYVGNASECESACLKNCECTGYAYDQEHGCQVWKGPLLNLKQFSEDNTYKQDFYLKLARLDLAVEDTNSTKLKDNRLKKIVIPIAVVVALGLIVYYVRRRKLRSKGEDLLRLDLGTTQKANNSEDGVGRKRQVQMPLFSFASVSAATDNFSATNKLGEGGFGPVYKGILLEGGEVAVKRLSKRSGQGWEELKNEAMLIAKLQHKNLVRLLGCCIEGDEKILVYEYMPNRSLDFLLFDPEKCNILDWRTRVGIIEGIAQGLLYLHKYSRLRIIHRDLKPSNILLDIDMNPKISDFGMARIFGVNESQANTNRIVGTYGYMSPEYALEGLFSIKSDVFSFGVLLLEIVSGKKNTGFYQRDCLHLIGRAWELWTSDRGSDLVDPLLDDISSMQMVLRYVHIALLCVQESAEDRPTMSDVVAMLSNESAVLPYPNEPAFLNVRNTSKANPINRHRLEICSMSGATFSIMKGR